MPDPARLALASLKVARRRGLEHGQAVWKLIGVVRACQRWIGPGDTEFGDWLGQLEACCWRLSQTPRPPATDTKEHDHGG